MNTPFDPAARIRAWQREASGIVQEGLCAHVRQITGSRFSRKYLYQLACGQRPISSELAAAIELATLRLQAFAPPGKTAPEPIRRTELSRTCASCRYAPACLTSERA